MIYLFILAITISFNETKYKINEDSKVVQPVLVLSNPLPIDTTVQVRDKVVHATGE